MDRILTEKDVENLFAGKKKRNSRRSLYLIYGGLTVFLVALFFVVINGPSFVARVDYWYQSDFAPAKNDNATNSWFSASSSQDSSQLPENTIAIERIDIKAPITWDVVNDPSTTSKALEKGTIHLAGTAHPGEIGNVFITGHSSNYIWAPGNYKSIFATLNNMVVGDKIQIEYRSKIFTYKVTRISVIKPTDLSVLAQGKDSTLSIVTCTPVGTSLNRLVVSAVQTNPDAAFNTKNPNLQKNTSLPKTR